MREHTSTPYFSERRKKGPSCSTSIAFVSVGQLSRPRADHSRRRSSLDGRTNWRRGAEYPLCPGAQWVKRRRGPAVPASEGSPRLSAQTERCAATAHGAGERPGVQRNKGPNYSSRALVQHEAARVLGGDNECHEMQVIFVPEGIMQAGGVQWLSTLAAPGPTKQQPTA